MSEGLPIRWLADSLLDPPTVPPVLVDGMLRCGEMCAIGAPRAVGKSWLVLDIAALVGRGDGLLFGKLQVTRSVPVLIAHGETAPWMAALRWKMLLGDAPAPPVAETFDLRPISIVNVREQHREGDGSSLWSEERREARRDDRLRQAIVEHGIGLVILDPWACFYGGDENSNDQVETAVSKLRDLAQETGAAIVLVHHLSKAQEGRDPEDLWRGASRLADAVATRVTLMPCFTGTNGANEAHELGLSPEQARRYVNVRFLRREEPTAGFTACRGTDGWWQAVDGSGPMTPVEAESRLSVDDVTTALATDGGTWTSLNEASTSLGLRTRVADLAIKRAIDAGRVDEIASPIAGARAFRLVTTAREEVDEPF